MKHYLDLIPISAKVHRKQSRMTRICIILAVFLVTVIFGMADMEMRAQRLQSQKSDGGWHAGFKEITAEQAAIIASRPEIKASAWYDVLNYRLDEGYQLQGNDAVICGFDEELLDMFPGMELEEGEFPKDTHSAVFTKSVKEQLQAANPNIVGVVLNKVDTHKGSYYGKKYGSYYGKYYK